MNGFPPFPQAAPFPTADEAVRDLEDFVPVIWEAIDSAITGATSFFADRREPICPSLFPNLVRYFAKQFFSNLHLEAADDDLKDFESIGLANNGLCLVRGRYAIRIRKSDNGLLPVPGPSITLQQFYRQQLPLPFNLLDRPAQIPDTSLFVLWDVDTNYHLVRLQLVAPQSGDVTRASVNQLWATPLPDPFATLSREESAADLGDLEEIQPLEQPNSTRQLS